jgi:hypothetical protein
MRISLWLIFIVISVACAIQIGRGMGIFKSSNIDERKKYWTEQISGSLTVDTTIERLEAFAKSHGQTLRCRKNAIKEGDCVFDDQQSAGGTRNIPVYLSVVFRIEDNRVISHRFETSPGRPG